MPTKALPRVRLEARFVRDYQRRLRLVVEVVEEELRRESTGSKQGNVIPKSDHKELLSALHSNSGGEPL